MYNIIFYENKHGEKELENWILDLNKKAKAGNKDARINLNKVVAYMDLLEKMGTRVGKPVTKHLTGEIWELRPLDNRILYAYYKDDTFILLHQFVKRTKKTPRKELVQAVRNLRDYKERNGEKYDNLEGSKK